MSSSGVDPGRVNHIVGIGAAPSVGSLVGWGSGASASAVSGNDVGCFFTITAGTGPSPSPTFVVTFAQTYGTSPTFIGVANFGNGGAAAPALLAVSQSASAPTFTFVGTPTGALNYGIQIIVIGK